MGHAGVQVLACALLTAECLWQCATVVLTRGLSGAGEATTEASRPRDILTTSLEAWSRSAELFLRYKNGEADERPASEFSVLGGA
jgi:hypothetical protein